MTVGLVVCALACACTSDQHVDADLGTVLDPIVMPKSSPPVDAGRVVQSVDLDLGNEVSLYAALVKRVTYTSMNAVTNSASTVTGAVLTPRTSPPSGGWPVVAIAHATTGISRGCGPSWDRQLRGYTPTVIGLLRLGYAVSMTDYDGLGDSGIHPYLEPRTAAYNVIDSVRALRSIAPEASTRWVGYGDSQGGQAVWAADEYSDSYGKGLQLVAAVAESPAANVTALPELAAADQLTPDQKTLLPLVLEGATRSNPQSTDAAQSFPISSIQSDDLFGCDNEKRVAAAGAIESAGGIRIDPHP